MPKKEFRALFASIISIAFGAGVWATTMQWKISDVATTAHRIEQTQTEFKADHKTELAQTNIWRGLKDVKDAEQDQRLSHLEK